MRVCITGISSGLGHGLAKIYLERGAEVYGCWTASTRMSEESIKSSRFPQARRNQAAVVGMATVYQSPH